MKYKDRHDLYKKILEKERAAFVIDENLFKQNLNNMLTAFSAFYPNVSIGYSYKTNYIPAICKIAHDNKCWAEVVSEMEVEMALHNLADKSRIIYNGPVKTAASMQSVIEAGGIINVDDIYDIQLIEEILLWSDTTRFKANIALRINFTYGDAVSRFGMDFDELKQAVQMTQSNERLNLIGFHLHLPFRSIESFRFRVESLISILVHFKLENLKYINIGGGFFGNISAELARSLGLHRTPAYSDYAELIGTQLTNYFKTQPDRAYPMLFIEPGSSVVADVVSFISKIHKVKIINGKNIAVTFAGRHLLSATNKSVQLPIEIGFLKENPTEKQSVSNNYAIVGFTCIESDILGNVWLNHVPDQNCFVIVKNTGSYSVVLGSDFILPQPAIYMISHSKIRLIRKAKLSADILKSYKNSRTFK